MNSPSPQASARYNRAQVHTALAKLTLSPALHSLAQRLLQLLADDGTASVEKLHAELFPLAATASASAQLSKLLKAIEKSSEGRLSADYLGEKKRGVGARSLYFTGPRQTGQADTEGLNAIPPAQLVSGQEGIPLGIAGTIVLLTFNEYEFRAVLRAFLHSGVAPAPDNTRGVPIFPLGQHGGFDLLLHHSAQGNRASQRSASDLRLALQPLAIVAVGIAFGINENKQDFGDVLVSKFIVDYETGKVHPRGTITPRSERPPASHRWVEAFRQLDITRSNGADSAVWPKLRLGGVLTGEKLVDDLDYRDSLVAVAGQDDVVGGEMEAAGLYHALKGTHTEWVVVKAICDFADGKKGVDKDRRQADAAHNAACVAKALFDSGLLRYVDAPGPVSQRPTSKQRSGDSQAESTPSARQWRARIDPLDIGAEPVPGQGAELGELETLGEARPRDQTATESRPRVVALDDILTWATRPGTDKGGANDQPLYALLGEYGMGKTTTCQRAYTVLHESRTAGEAVPLAHYFDLRKVDLGDGERGGARVPTLAETITDCLRHGYLHDSGVAPRYEDVLDDIKSGVVIFFDGLDEVLARLPEKQGLNFTANLLKVLPEAQRMGAPMPRVLLSCRTQFFRNLREQNSHLSGEHRGGQPAAQFRALLLLPFTETQIRAYLQAALPGADTDALLKLIGDVHNLRELAQRPFLLKLVARYIPRLEQWRAQGRTVTGATLYREMAREWLVRDKGKQSFQAEDKEHLAADMTGHLVQVNRRGLTASELETWLNKWLAQQDPHATFQLKPRELLQEDLRNSTFLKRIDAADPQNSRFEFAHSSLFEFFLAMHLLNALREGGTARQRWVMAVPSDETLDFLGQLMTEEPGLLGQLNQWNLHYQPQASEVQLAYALRAWRRGWPMPALQGMDLQGAQLEGWHFGGNNEEPVDHARRLDLQGLRFGGAVLRRARFWHADLQQAQFDRAALDQAEFLHCRLAGASWADAELGGAAFRPAADGPAAAQLARPAAAHLELALGHTLGITACAFSPDGRSLLSASGDKTLRLWDIATGALLRRFDGHQGGVTACAFSPDGRSVLSASADKTLRLWDAATGALLRRFNGHQDWVMACAFSPDGRSVLSASADNTLRLWDAATGALLRRFDGHQGVVTACASSPDGRSVLSASGDNTLRLWDAATGALLCRFDGHEDGVSACAFSPDGRKVLSASGDKTLRLWEAATGALLRRFDGHEAGVNACAFSPDGRSVLSASYDRNLHVWDAVSGALVLRIIGHSLPVWACSFSRDGRIVLSASDDNTLRLWDAATGALLRRFENHQGGVGACAFSPDGRSVLSAARDETLRLWDAASGALLRRFNGHQEGVRACTFSPDGRSVLSASRDETLRLWDAASGALLRRFDGPQGVVLACAFSPDGRSVLTASGDKSLLMWDAAAGVLLRRFEGHLGWVSSCAFSPDGRWVLSGSIDCTLRLWDAASGALLRSFDGHAGGVEACAFSRDGRWVISASRDSNLVLWDATTGALLRRFEGHQGWGTQCAFSPDGCHVLSASSDKTLRLWDVVTGALLRRFEGHQSAVVACAFSPDSRWVRSVSGDNTLRLWDAQTGQLLSNHLHAPNASAAWLPDGSELLHASGAAWRYLRWWGTTPDHPLGGSWPLECPPRGKTVVVEPWPEQTLVTTQGIVA